MNITITGSLGHISKPLTENLVKKGHHVTVISSKADKQAAIEALGATAAIGSLEDIAFLTKAFTGADVVYCMVPPNYFAESNVLDYYKRLGTNYVEAIKQSGVKRVIHLSSYGAHLEKGTGLIVGSHNVEEMLNKIPGISVTHMRPAYFNYNFNNFIGVIKHTGMIMANYGGDDKLVFVSPLDIAAAIADEVDTPRTGVNVRYVASEELTGNEIATTLGEAVGKPDLKWRVIPDEQMQAAMEGSGLPASLAAMFVEMFSAMRQGKLSEEYYKNPPAEMGKERLKDFAKEFAENYNAA
jgi:uncharacterized protein YbjT (DUF2867 family)